ncbi:hypothetical protein QBC33DRAFT_619118 [Phialemonium atrogriseum]|uniref:Uncharacterized protein n=1 Tax=Phialemonium atrogriseum TaxID=1093897 RepID=A0AAJ0C181_9PEZI|nr:uncharacterized protein QBC33DRAFT_619118 [Phialemonium atrogriseum]KAK1768275.1 hypothetical protein QBC33DRAFT_619118 [Phialemonium atrogriseum]
MKHESVKRSQKGQAGSSYHIQRFTAQTRAEGSTTYERVLAKDIKNHKQQATKKGFPEASLNENSDKYLDKLKDEHHHKKHSGSTDNDRDTECGSPSGTHGKRKRKKKTTGTGELSAHTQPNKAAENTSLSCGRGKRRRHGKLNCVEAYPERMTGDQDIKFEKWLKECGKNDSKGENTKPKYHSLCRCLFGKSVSPPENPYYDYLEPRYYIDQVLASNQLPSVAVLEARLSSLHVDPKGVDPYSLDDNASAEPTRWGIPQGTDSGYYSWEKPEPQPDQQWPPLPTYATDAVEADDDSRGPMPHIPAGLAWPAQNTGLTLNDLTVSGTSTEPFAYPDEVDDTDFNVDYGSDEHDEGPS